MRTIPSETVGLFAFIPAAFTATLAFFAAAKAGRRERRAWATITAVYLLLTAEAVAKTRYAIAGDLRRLAIEAGAYSDRRAPQAFALLILGAAAVAIMARMVRSGPTWASGIARGATVAVLTVFIGESVSLHAIDSVAYRFAGPIRLVCWLWLACGWTTTAAAIHCIQRPR